MKLRAWIVDDEPLAHEILLDYAAEVPFLDITAQLYRATEALSRLGDEEVDLIFLDIQMPKLGGLDLLRIVDHRPLVIVTSAHAEHALEGFELEVCDYLLKPFRFERFLKACQRARDRHRLLERPTPRPGAQEAPAEPGRLFLKVDQRWINLALDDISHLESYGNYVKVWTGDRHHLTLRTLASFEEELPPDHFLRIHKSHMVNKTHVAYVEDNVVRLASGRSLPVGKSRRPAFRKFMGR